MTTREEKESVLKEKQISALQKEVKKLKEDPKKDKEDDWIIQKLPLVVCAIVFGVLAFLLCGDLLFNKGCKVGYQKAQEEQKSQSMVEKTDQFVADLEKLSQNPEKSKEYFETIAKLTSVVKEEVKKNPEGMQSFLQDMIDTAAKAGPGLSLYVEDYASAKVKEEIAQLRQESGTAKLQDKEEQISALQKELKKLKGTLGIWISIGEEVSVLLINRNYGTGASGFKFINKESNGKVLAFLCS